MIFIRKAGQLVDSADLNQGKSTTTKGVMPITINPPILPFRPIAPFEPPPAEPNDSEDELNAVGVAVESVELVIGATGLFAAFCLNCAGVWVDVGLIARTPPCWH